MTLMCCCPDLTSSWGTALAACRLLVVPQRVRALIFRPAFDVALVAPVTLSVDRGSASLAFLEPYTDATSGCNRLPLGTSDPWGSSH